MNPEAQREAIARACGVWKQAANNYKLPDYLNDLNAMHEAEKVLTDEQYTEYENKMWDIQSDQEGNWRAIPTAAGGSVNMPTKRVRMSSCTAAQRAEAFLKTLELWVACPTANEKVCEQQLNKK